MNQRAQLLDEALPHGWVADINADGRRFYRNRRTGETQWIKPTEEAPTERAAHDSAVIIASQADAEETKPMASLAAVLGAPSASGDTEEHLMDVETFGVAADIPVHGVRDGRSDDQAGEATRRPGAKTTTSTLVGQCNGDDMGAAIEGSTAPEITAPDGRAADNSIDVPADQTHESGACASNQRSSTGAHGGSDEVSKDSEVARLREALLQSGKALSNAKREAAQMQAHAREQLKQTAWALQEAEAAARAAREDAEKAQAASAEAEAVEAERTKRIEAEKRAAEASAAADSATLREKEARAEAEKLQAQLAEARAAAKTAATRAEAGREREATLMEEVQARAKRAAAAATARIESASASAAEAEAEAASLRTELLAAREAETRSSLKEAQARRELERCREELRHQHERAAAEAEKQSPDIASAQHSDPQKQRKELEDASAAAISDASKRAERAESRAAAAEVALRKAQASWSAQLADARTQIEVQASRMRGAGLLAAGEQETIHAGGIDGDADADGLRHLLRLWSGIEGDDAGTPAHDHAAVCDLIANRLGSSPQEVQQATVALRGHTTAPRQLPPQQQRSPGAPTVVGSSATSVPATGHGRAHAQVEQVYADVAASVRADSAESEAARAGWLSWGSSMLFGSDTAGQEVSTTGNIGHEDDDDVVNIGY